MSRKTVTDLSAWPSLNLEGNLIAPAMMAKIATPQDDEATRTSYRIRKGISLRDEIATAFRVGQSHYYDFSLRPVPSASAAASAHTARYIQGFLAETLGFDDLVVAEQPLALMAGGRVPVVVIPPSEDGLDRRSRSLSAERSRSAAFALQDFLNRSEQATWGLVTDGNRIRLMRDNASLTRPAYIDIDLQQMFTTEDAASFAAFWLLVHRTRFGLAGTAPTECFLEQWRDTGAREGVVARDRLAAQVQDALRLLGNGFLDANPKIARALRSGQIDLTQWFNELLRLVYRLIFLMVAEDRNLLHPAEASPASRELYRDGYSLMNLRQQCIRGATWDRYHDRYESIKIVFRALAGDIDAEPTQTRLALPPLGGLFTSNQLPHLGDAQLKNRDLMQALYHLSWLRDGGAIVPVNWRAMETEELGSVYESLLELQPQLSEQGLVFASDSGERRGNQRKTTGSYYTPDSLVQALLDTVLDPVLDQADDVFDDASEWLLQLNVIDPACGSGHFLLAATRRIASRVARWRAAGTPTIDDFRSAVRDVARRCIYGVDRNPMAVELTKVALWIETVQPGRPLGFFDSQIRTGDSLLGVFDLQALQAGIPDDAYKPLVGDDREVARHYQKANRETKRSGQGEFDFLAGKHHMPATKPPAHRFSGFRHLPEDTVEQIQAKAQQYQQLRQADDFQAMKAACDLYVAAFLMPKNGDLPQGFSDRDVPTSDEVWNALAGEPLSEKMEAAQATAQAAHAFHWPLEFADIMLRGGFDVVLGNPPWERIKLQEQEFFSSRSADIALAPNKAARDRLIRSLADKPAGSPSHKLYQDFISAKREAEAASLFVRTSDDDKGRFPLTGRGDVNTYALFAELFSKLTIDRAGVILPTGIATDATTAIFFADIVAKQKLVSLFDFENRQGIFPAIDSRIKFCLLTMGQQSPIARFSFFLTDPSQLKEPNRSFALTPSTLARINPNTKTSPVFRSRADAELTSKIYDRVPVLVRDGLEEQLNPWSVRFVRLFDMSNDSHCFETARTLQTSDMDRDGTDWVDRGKRFVPLYEAKLIHQYDHRWAAYEADGKTTNDLTLAQKQDTECEAVPRYWVDERHVLARLTPLPGTFVEAINDGNADDLEITVTGYLFTHQLAELGIDAAWRQGIWPLWQSFVGQHRRFADLSPAAILPVQRVTEATLPAGTEPSDAANLLPSSASAILPADRDSAEKSPSRQWYPVDRERLHDRLATADERSWLPQPDCPIVTDNDLLEYAEQIVRASCRPWLMGWRDITNATNERTVIATVIPRSAVGNKLPLILSQATPGLTSGLLANLSSIVFDFVARQKLGGTTLNFFIIKQFPVLPPDFYTPPRLDFVTPRVLELTYTSHSLAPFARDLGYEGEPFAWDESRRAVLRAELDAFYARAYGLDRDELRYILDPGSVKGDDYPSETFRVLRDKEIRQWGEYRTARLVLEAWDRFESNGQFSELQLPNQPVA